MEPETEGAQWEAVQRLGAGSRHSRGQGRIHGPGSTAAHSINPHGHQGENLICLQHMQALIYNCLQPLRNKNKTKIWCRSISTPLTAKQRAGDEPEAEGKCSRRLFISGGLIRPFWIFFSFFFPLFCQRAERGISTCHKTSKRGLINDSV